MHTGISLMLRTQITQRKKSIILKKQRNWISLLQGIQESKDDMPSKQVDSIHLEAIIGYRFKEML